MSILTKICVAIGLCIDLERISDTDFLNRKSSLQQPMAQPVYETPLVDTPISALAFFLPPTSLFKLQKEKLEDQPLLLDRPLWLPLAALPKTRRKANSLNFAIRRLESRAVGQPPVAAEISTQATSASSTISSTNAVQSSASTAAQSEEGHGNGPVTSVFITTTTIDPKSNAGISITSPSVSKTTGIAINPQLTIAQTSTNGVAGSAMVATTSTAPVQNTLITASFVDSSLPSSKLSSVSTLPFTATLTDRIITANPTQTAGGTSLLPAETKPADGNNHALNSESAHSGLGASEKAAIITASVFIVLAVLFIYIFRKVTLQPSSQFRSRISHPDKDIDQYATEKVPPPMNTFPIMSASRQPFYNTDGNMTNSVPRSMTNPLTINTNIQRIDSPTSPHGVTPMLPAARTPNVNDTPTYDFDIHFRTFSPLKTFRFDGVPDPDCKG